MNHAGGQARQTGIMPYLRRKPPVDHEDPFIHLEIKHAQQEDLLDELNKTIYRQERRIDQLEAMVAKLADHLRTLRDAGQAPLNERPPHY